jgi:uridine kinase
MSKNTVGQSSTLSTAQQPPNQSMTSQVEAHVPGANHDLHASPSGTFQDPDRGLQQDLTSPPTRRHPFFEKGPAYENRHHCLKKRLTIIISGCATSGKTTLAHILAGLFSSTTSKPLEDPNAEEKNKENKDTAATKVILVHQEDFRLPRENCPLTEWFEHDPPIYAGDHPQDAQLNDSYWAAAVEANIGVSPHLMESRGDIRFPADFKPMPRMVINDGSNMDCRMSIDWPTFFARANRGMMNNDGDKGVMATEEGRKLVKEYMDQMDANFVNRLKSLIRKFIVDQTSRNSKCGFKGRAVVNGAIQDIFIMEGPLLCILGVGTEKLMDHCDVKIFLPTSKGVAINRRLNRLEENGEAYERDKAGGVGITEGYFEGVVW